VTPLLREALFPPGFVDKSDDVEGAHSVCCSRDDDDFDDDTPRRIFVPKGKRDVKDAKLVVISFVRSLLLFSLGEVKFLFRAFRM